MTDDDLTRLRDEVAGVLKWHRRDSMSQDSGNHCVCGSDSRFEQRGGDHPWATFEQHLADALLPLLARVRDEARAATLREAADAWQVGGWTVLTAPIKAPGQPQRILGAAQAATEWLRDRADVLAAGDGDEEGL